MARDEMMSKTKTLQGGKKSRVHLSRLFEIVSGFSEKKMRVKVYCFIKKRKNDMRSNRFFFLEKWAF